MNKLFDQDCDDDDGKLQVNENYAGRYNRWREKEEFEKREYFFLLLSLLSFHTTIFSLIVKSKYGEDAALNLLGDSDDSSSTSESEDENGEVSTAILMNLFPTYYTLQFRVGHLMLSKISAKHWFAWRRRIHLSIIPSRSSSLLKWLHPKKPGGKKAQCSCETMRENLF